MDMHYKKIYHHKHPTILRTSAKFSSEWRFFEKHNVISTFIRSFSFILRSYLGLFRKHPKPVLCGVLHDCKTGLKSISNRKRFNGLVLEHEQNFRLKRRRHGVELNLHLKWLSIKMKVDSAP